MNIKNIAGYISRPLCEEHERRIGIIDAHDFSGVVRKMREHSPDLSDEDIADGIFALKQYYAIALLDPANGHAVSREVDAFWHAHMLFSKSYDDFCKQIVGEFMHHQPMDRADKAQIEKGRRLYLYTIAILEQVFSEVGEKMWPRTDIEPHLICWHFGKSSMYPDVQAIRLFEPKGSAYEVGV